MWRVIAAVVAVGWMTGIAAAQPSIVLDEIVGSWQGDDEIQYVELTMLADGLNGLANGTALVFDDAKGSDGGRRTAIFTQNVARGLQGAKVLVASNKARNLSLVQPEFLLPADFLRPRAGRVCFAVRNASGSFVPVDCVAYGAFTGDNGAFGAPTLITPDNRALERVALTGRNRSDWTGVLDPVLENNVGATGTLPPTLCGDGIISQGEECDGAALGGATCESLRFAKGKLVCKQCHYDTTKCTACGNGVINGKEECDGGDLGGRTCSSIGYTGGVLACIDEDCTLTTAGCDHTFFVPGGGPPRTECLAEWRVTNARGGPDATGRVAGRQRCKDGDSGCDADGTADGTCTFTVAPCFNRSDARFARCAVTSISTWTLGGKVDPASPAVVALIASVAALGPSTVDGTVVAFTPALATIDACGDPVAVPVPVRKRVVLRSRAAGTDGRPPDRDVLKLACTP